MARVRKHGKKGIKLSKGDYFFILLLITGVICSTVLIHASKVVDVAAYYIKMDEVVESKDFLDRKTEYVKSEDGKSTLKDFYKIDDDTLYSDSIAFVINYIDGMTAKVYSRRLCIFYLLSTVTILFSIYLILNRKKYLLLFFGEITGIIVITCIGKSTIFALSFVYLPVLGLLYYLYNLKRNAS